VEYWSAGVLECKTGFLEFSSCLNALLQFSITPWPRPDF
jgi:hypothetical protein